MLKKVFNPKFRTEKYYLFVNHSKFFEAEAILKP